MPGPVVLRRAAALAAEAVVVTYPLVLMDLARRQLTATRTAGPLRAPVNQFAHMPRLPLASSAPVITPNVDTVTSSAWLDLSAEPLVLSLPDTGGRYYAMPIYDAWTTAFATLGARTTGTRAREYVVAGNGWKGRLPRGMAVVQSPTALAWILVHLRSDGARDDEEVRRLQQQIRLTPLSRWPGDAGPDREQPVPGPAVAPSPVAQVSRMDPHEYFGRVARLLMDNPPHRADRARLERMAGLGVGPGRPPAWSRHDRLLVREIARGMADGLAQLEATAAQVLSNPWSWSCPSDLARRPADPLLRAASAWTGLGTWPRRDGLVYTTDVDSQGRTLTGEHSYVFRLAPGAAPPARAFWSLTAHPRDALAHPQTRRRLAVGDRDRLSLDPDGSLTIHLQPDPPELDHANWLPTPAGPYGLALRLYWPEPAALDGSWRPPAVLRPAASAQTTAEAPAKVAGPG
jgi:hypothetical protein